MEFITQAVAEGKSAAAIADHLGMSEPGVRNIVKRLGLKLAPCRRGRPFLLLRPIDITAFPGNPREVYWTLREQGYTAGEIGHAFGVSRNAVIGQWNRYRASQELAA